MAAILEQCQRGREDGRKAKKTKCSCSKNIVCWCLAFLLFILPGAASVPVKGQKGGSITLKCSLKNREDLSIVLTFGHITAYGRGQNEHFWGRVHKSGSCDLILQDLNTTDAGKYISNVFANGQPLDSYTYDVRVYVNLTGWKGEELMFDELPRETENVMHFTDPNWTEVWSKERGVLTHRLSDKNGRLTIKNFSSSDAGIYRALNSSGGILLTVTVTESSTGSKDKLDGTHEDEPHDRERVPVWIGIGVVVVLVVLIVFAVIKIRQHLKRNEERNSYQEVQMKETAQGPRSPNNSSGCLVCLQCQQICRGSCQHIIPDSVS